MTEPDRFEKAVLDVYADAARNPDASLCCPTTPPFVPRDLVIPQRCLDMNYGCGSTVDPLDLGGERPILYVGVGGGLEALQFAWARRFVGGVIAVDPVADMREAARRNLEEAARLNPWFDPSFVTIVDGDAKALPVASGTVGLVAQNCLFNVFVDGDLEQALAETHRVLAEGGKFATSDPIAQREIPKALRDNPTLRARCISGCRTYEGYLGAIFDAGFATIEVRARRPYRLLLPAEHPELDSPLLLESVDLVATRNASCEAKMSFSGRAAIYTGEGSKTFSGMTFTPGAPVAVSDRMAQALSRRSDFVITPPTWHVRGAGCC
jgi:SAM-dependent methyltransferase